LKKKLLLFWAVLRRQVVDRTFPTQSTQTGLFETLDTLVQEWQSVYLHPEGAMQTKLLERGDLCWATDVLVDAFEGHPPGP
jgi:hypothetical protein